MNKGKTIFAQLMSLFTEYEFSKCVKRYNGDRHSIKFNCRDQFLVMSFAQFTNRSGLRDIETTLDLCSQDLYRSGLKIMPKSTLAEANEKKDWRIYQDFGYIMIQKAKKLYEGEKLRIDLDEMVCAFDSSTIELCLALCPWATLHHGKGGFKMHTLMDLKGFIPIFIRLAEASIHDSKVMDEIPVVANAYYLMDKGYVKFDSLYKHFHQNHAWFVTRAKDNMLYTVTESREVDTQTGLISDETIQLTGFYTSQKYPDNLRLVVYQDFRDRKVYRFLTNNFSIDALTFAELYRERWQIEIFFKWIKQHLHLKTFYGTTRNAVYTQIWIAICDYLLLIIAKKQYGLKPSLHTISNSIGQILFKRGDIRDFYNKPDEPEISLPPLWQSKYIDLVSKIFSYFRGCHIIIATHSHFLVTDLVPKKSSVVVLKNDGKTIIGDLLLEPTYGWSAEDILLDVFKTPSTRNYYLSQRISRMLELIADKQNETEEYRQLRKQVIPFYDVLKDTDPLKDIIALLKDK